MCVCMYVCLYVTYSPGRIQELGIWYRGVTGHVISTKAASSEVTGGHFILYPWHKKVISGLMNEPKRLKFVVGYIWIWQV